MLTRLTMLMVMLMVTLLSLVLGLVAGCAPAPGAEKPQDFYRGKTISIYTGEAGGAGDAFSRALAPFLERETGAKIVVENQPGGGTTEAINLAFKAKTDGLTLLVFDTLPIVLPEWLGQSGAVWKLAEFNWLARMAFQPITFAVSPQTTYQSIQDLQKAKGLKFGSSAAGTLYGAGNALVAWALNLDAKVILGFKGTAGILLAVQKGEIDGSIFPEDRAEAGAKAGQLRPLFTVSGKSELFPNLPVLDKVVQLTKEQEMMFRSLAGATKAIVTAPGVPEDRLDFLAKALERIDKDKNAQQTIMQKTGMAGWHGFTPRGELQKYMSDPNIGSEGKRLLPTLFKQYHK